MATIPGSVRVAGFIAPSDSTDEYATHEDIYGRGGFVVVDDTTMRDAIPLDRRKVGMLVYSVADSLFYQCEVATDPPTWSEADMGGGSANFGTEFSVLAVDMIDETDFVLEETAPVTTEGLGYNLVVTPTTGRSGTVTVILYGDAARLIPVYSMVVSLPDSSTYFSLDAFGFSLETVGTLYGTLYVTNVDLGETCDISLQALATLSTSAPVPVPTPYGDGIEDDGLGNPRVALASNSGLTFSLGKLVVDPDLTAPAYPSLGAGGMSITGVVDTSTDQEVSAKKNFDAVGCTLQASEGPPIAGTYVAGMEIVDSDGIKWRCTLGGTPGDWELADSVFFKPSDSFTAVLSAGDSELVQIPVYGRVGTLTRLQVWGIAADTSDYSIPFRVRVYENLFENGRELVWQGNGLARQTSLDADFLAGTTGVSVNDNNVADVDESIVIYEDETRYELGRIVARPTGDFTLDEALIDPDTWTALDGIRVCVVNEWFNVSYVDTTNQADKYVYLQIRHDGLVTDPDMQFVVMASIVCNGLCRSPLVTVV